MRVSLSETEVASSSDRLWIVSDFHTEGPHQRQPPASLSTITADAAIDPLGPSGFEGEKVGVGGGGGGVWKRLSKLNLPPQRPPFSRDAWQKHTHRPVPFQPLTRKPSGAASLALSLSLSLHLPLCSLLSFWGLAGFFFWLLLLCLSLSLSGTSRPAALIVARCII